VGQANEIRKTANWLSFGFTCDNFIVSRIAFISWPLFSARQLRAAASGLPQALRGPSDRRFACKYNNSGAVRSGSTSAPRTKLNVRLAAGCQSHWDSRTLFKIGLPNSLLKIIVLSVQYRRYGFWRLGNVCNPDFKLDALQLSPREC
jgi:hypothetical protein